MWSNLVSFTGPSSSTLHQVPPTSSDNAKEIREIVEENLRELIPQYLKEPFKAAGVSSIATQPTAPRRLLEGPSDLPLLAESGDGGGTIDRTRFSGDFTFKIPRLQETKGNRADRSLPLFTPEVAVETQIFGPRVAFPLQTPTHKLSRENSSFTFRGRTTHDLDQSSVSQKSGRHHGPLEPPLPQDDQASSKVYPLTTAFEGSSPTLQIAANRSLRQPPVNPQRKFYLKVDPQMTLFYQKLLIIVSRGEVRGLVVAVSLVLPIPLLLRKRPRLSGHLASFDENLLPNPSRMSNAGGTVSNHCSV